MSDNGENTHQKDLERSRRGNDNKIEKDQYYEDIRNWAMRSGHQYAPHCLTHYMDTQNYRFPKPETYEEYLARTRSTQENNQTKKP